MNLKTKQEIQQQELTEQSGGFSRRSFFRLAGGIAGAGIVISACHRTPPSTFFVGSGDIGLLNYLYILKQVQSNFYIQANATPYYGMDESELLLIADIRDHHIAQRDFLQTVLSSNALPNIVTNFSTVTFAVRSNVLSFSTKFEDLAVGAMNGAIPLFTDTSYVPWIAKMATVNARHAAYVRDITTYNTFADGTVIATNGLDQSLLPLTVMSTLEKYIQTLFDTSKLPN